MPIHMNEIPRFNRGSEWRQWDLHIHTPASFEWSGKRFALMDESEKRAEIDKMIIAINKATPVVFALMDYWTFDGWLALKKRLKETGAPNLKAGIAGHRTEISFPNYIQIKCACNFF